MAFCTNCGAPMEGQFCPYCGAPSGATAPTTGEPVSPAPIPQAPAPAPKKTSPLVWVLAGCGGLLVIGIIVALGLGFFVSRKASEFGKNPGFAAAKMMASLNPNVEVLKADESTGKITLREKKTGKTVTMDFQDIQKGHIAFEGDNGERVDIRGEGQGGSGSMTMEGPEGSMRIGQGSLASVPSWVPKYPGAEAAGALATQGRGEQGGTFQLKCSDSPEQVAAFYEREMKGAGMKVERHSFQAGNRSLLTVAGTDEAQRRTITATISSTGEGTAAQIIYGQKP